MTKYIAFSGKGQVAVWVKERLVQEEEEGWADWDLGRGWLRDGAPGGGGRGREWEWHEKEEGEGCAGDMKWREFCRGDLEGRLRRRGAWPGTLDCQKSAKKNKTCCWCFLPIFKVTNSFELWQIYCPFLSCWAQLKQQHFWTTEVFVKCLGLRVKRGFIFKLCPRDLPFLLRRKRDRLSHPKTFRLILFTDKWFFFSSVYFDGQISQFV